MRDELEAKRLDRMRDALLAQKSRDQIETDYKFTLDLLADTEERLRALLDGERIQLGRNRDLQGGGWWRECDARNDECGCAEHIQVVRVPK